MPRGSRKQSDRRQRPVSCRFCRTRKLRCSRDAPCSNCVSRGMECELENQVVAIERKDDSPTPALAERLRRIEAALAARSNDLAERSPRSATQQAKSIGSGCISDITTSGISSQVEALESDVAWLASIYTEQNLAGKVPSSKVTFRIRPVQEILNAQAQFIQNGTFPSAPQDSRQCIWLPEFYEAQILMEVFLREVHHLPYVTYVPSLQTILAEVYADLTQHRQVNPGQILLVLGVLVSATQSWTASDCRRGAFSHTVDAHNQTPILIKVVEDVLDIVHRSNEVSMEGVQGVILTSFVSFNVEGISRRGRALYSMAVLMARELGLHRIDHPANVSHASTAQAEVGRRVWWYICASDWSLAVRLTGVMEGVYTCHPRHMITQKPLNINDEDIFDGMERIGRPISEPTTMSYSLQRIYLGELSRRTVDRAPLSMARSGVGAGANHDLEDIDTELQTLTNNIPPFFRMTVSQIMETYGFSQSRAATIVHQGNTIHFLVYTQRCKLHLPFFTRGFVDPAWSWSREICVKMARLVIQSEIHSDAMGICSISRFKFAGLLLGVFMASIVLLVDLCMNKSSPHFERQQQEVADAFRILDNAKSESETTAKFVDSLTTILRRQGVCPVQVASSQRAQTRSATSGKDGGVARQPDYQPGLSSVPDLDNCELAAATNSFDQIGNIPVEMPNTASYFGELAHNFEQGIGIDEFDWGSIFSNLDSTLL